MDSEEDKSVEQVWSTLADVPKSATLDRKSARMGALLTLEMSNPYIHEFNDLPSYEIDEMFDGEPKPKIPPTPIKDKDLSLIHI